MKIEKRVGIYTLYYNNINYGAQLQAYALCKAINRLGYRGEQVAINFTSETMRERISRIFRIIRSLGFLDLIYAIIEKSSLLIGIVINKIFNNKKIKIRYNKFIDFINNNIAHSRKTYNMWNVGETVENYDIFIAGSDQIWNPLFLSNRGVGVFCLGFVPLEKRKVSCAASIGKLHLTSWERRTMLPLIERLDWISVRESSGRKLLNLYTNRCIHIMPDPVFMLTRDEWTRMERPPDIDTPYIFCYFLSSDIRQRRWAVRFAERNRYRIVAIRHFGGFHISDLFFATDSTFAIGPAEFVGLIHHAKYVLTDSFHAVAMSILMNTRFYVFPRGNQNRSQNMNSRITDILKYYNNENRLINNYKIIATETDDLPHRSVEDIHSAALNMLNEALSGDDNVR